MARFSITLERWQRFTLVQQLLQIALELHCTTLYVDRGDAEEVRGNYERAMQLVDLTLEGLAETDLRHELVRLREVFDERASGASVDTESHNAFLRELMRLHPETVVQIDPLGL